MTANRALISNGSGKVAVSSITSTELSCLSGLSGNLQSHINNLASSDNTLNSHIGNLQTQINNLGNKLPKIVFNDIVGKGTGQIANIILEPNSMYLLFSMLDVSATVQNPYIMFIGTGTSAIYIYVSIHGNSSDAGWSSFPNNGQFVQGLYPKNGYYIRTTVMKIM